MIPKLRNMLSAVGVFVIAGVGYLVSTPQPATRSVAELRDAGITAGQRVVLTCPERLTPRTKRRINDAQPGALRPRQTYARVARVALCFGDRRLDGGTGNCIRPSDGATLAPFVEEFTEYRFTNGLDGGLVWQSSGAMFVLFEDGGAGAVEADRRADGGYFTRVSERGIQPEIIVPSLRRDVLGLHPDAGDDSDGGEDAVDDSWQFRSDDCSLTRCSAFDAGDGSAFCQRLNSLQLVASPCAMPNCWVGDGGAWVDDAVVDCRFSGPFGTADGGPRWRGCNTGPVEYSSGSACVPTECGVVAGDSAPDFL